jgi:molybdopterin-guanine dinucleotide biosynthesis adapter protein
MTQSVFGITGWKNSGKTTLAERLTAELTKRGWAISTVKHAHHAFDIDHAGTDSFRHRAAGAREVAIVSGARWALMHELRDDAEPALASILGRMSPCDLVLIEGYKRESHKKMEVRRLEANSREPMALSDPNIVAIAADHAVAQTDLPVFALDDVTAIADFVETLFLSPGR